MYKQVPNIGTEADEPEDRQLQATRIIHREVTAIQDLTEKHQCAHVPAWLGTMIEEQGNHDLVPHGYINYISWEKVSGIRLCDPDKNFVLFWSLPRQKRDRIRAAFKISYQYVFSQFSHTGQQLNNCFVKPNRKLYTAGIRPASHTINNLIWDAQQDKMYVSIPVSIWCSFRSYNYLIIYSIC